ncbi:MAG: pyridoxal phosphate-dependent aminotransferase [Paludibacteraceae bacterium]|nr:pyridoxal phosphate-dependent aminotransferase [Paludibacteraceae bacterium]
MLISNRIAALEESQTLQVAALCQQLRAEGVDVIGLSVGEPDFPAPTHIKQAAIDAVNNDISHYGPTPGFPALREAIAQTINKDLATYNVKPYNANEIVVSVGAKQALCNAIEAIVGPGDEVIMPTPCWVSYVEMVKIAQGKSVLVKTSMENNFCLTAEQLEEAITPNTKLLMLCTPNNPTGSVYTYDNLKAIVEVLKKHPQVVVLADEIYQHILYTGKHESLAQFQEIEDRLIIINGVSKAYAMTGYRIGWLASHDTDLLTAVKRLQGQTISCATTIAQKAAEAAYSGPQECVEEMRQAFERRRNLILELAKEIPGMKVLEPQGAFYLFPDVSAFFGKQYNGQTIHNANELVTYLLQEAHVALVSGSAFGEDNCIRFSYATSEDLITEAMRRVKEALSKLV